MLRWFLLLCALAFATACSDDPPPATDSGPDAGDVVEPVDTGSPRSCVADGGTPAPVTGRCTAVVRDAGLLRANEHDQEALVIPGGQRLVPAAARLPLPGFPLAMLRIPGTRRVIVTDGSINTRRLRVIDLSTPTPSLVPGSVVEYPRAGAAPQPSLFYGLALTADGRRLYASGGGGNRVYVFDVATSGALTADPARTIDFHDATSPSALYVSGLALSRDGASLYITLQAADALVVWDLARNAETRRVRFAPVAATGTDGRMTTLSPMPYAVVTRPGDDRHAYVSLWGTRQVAEVDLATGMPAHTWDVGKNPEELLFTPDGTRLLVAASDSDSVTTIDLSTPDGVVAMHYLGGDRAAPRGISPSALAWGPAPAGMAPTRVYVTEANENAVEVLDATTFARVGRIATEWYPTDVEVFDDGAVVVLTGKGVGLGPNDAPSRHDILELMAGSIARYPAADDTQLAMGHALVSSNNTVMRTFADVECPAGAADDFPVPRPGMGASTKIRHVVLIVRENKTYDALLGDLPTGLGDPALTIVPRDRMERVFPNFRALTRAFAGGDNFYSVAEQSVQGHQWTAIGRMTDFNERTWLDSWGRGQRYPLMATTVVGMPEEGSLFDAMALGGVRMENWGEAVALMRFAVPIARYGSAPQSLRYEDIRRARNFRDYAINNCALQPFTYIVLPNDHTAGGQTGYPTPESMFEDNDEATGLIIDALSHSTFWPDTLVIVIEDDPQDGGDRVDNHRTVVLMVSPWVKREYMSHVHWDNASVHRTIETILGLPPHNRTVANAGIMYDFFTATPDYRPYTYIPRRDPPVMNPTGRWAEASRHWDFSNIDDQPGLSRLIWRMTHDGQEPPWTEVPDDDGDD